MFTDPLAEIASQLQAFVRTEHPFIIDLDLATLQSIEWHVCPSNLLPALFS